MKLSVLTPSFNTARWLPACVASVKHAGAGLDYEHWVMDGGSTDDTVTFLKSHPEVQWVSAPDQGMYDALNKGFPRTKGEIIGHLNADEQYNRAGLRAALARLEAEPALDAVFGPTVMVDAEGKFLQLFKQVVVPRPEDAQWHMPVQSCSLLCRRKIWERLTFDPSFRIVADHVWFRKQMELGLSLAPVGEPIGVFTWRADNLSNVGAPENALAGINKNSWQLKLAKYRYRWRKLLAGGYRPQPVSYEIQRNGATVAERIERPALKLPPGRLRGPTPARGDTPPR